MTKPKQAIILSSAKSPRRSVRAMREKNVSIQTLRRLPLYLHYLKSVKDDSPRISAAMLASALGLNDVQVRKDLGSVSGSGRPKKGYVTEELIVDLEKYLGCNSVTNTVLIGAGNLGRALLSYSGFSDYGLQIVAAFDSSDRVVGTKAGDKTVLPMSELGRVCIEKTSDWV